MIRVGQGYDVHPLVEQRKLVLGGVAIPFERGAFGHSDADVLAHALADAVLGAAGLSDLGTRFPATDPRWKDADSMQLLERCAHDVRAAGYAIVNVDAVIVVDRPKLAAFLDQMRDNIAARLSIDADCVGIKAKSSEGLGFTGDGSGIAAYAVALVERPTQAGNPRGRAPG